MYVARIPNRGSRPAILLCESWREGKRVRKRTLANLSRWPEAKVAALKQVLRGETLVPAGEAFQVQRTLPHGHVAAVLGTLRRLGLEGVLASRPSRERALGVAMIVARILDPRPKLATARGFREESAFTTLAEALGVEGADEDELYQTLDWLGKHQERIEAKLAHRHLVEGTLVLYDLTTTYFEGRTCPLARRGRPGEKEGKLEIVIGLVCTPEGCPVAVEVFAGNTSDPETLAPALRKVRERFGLKRVVFVGDRGLLTEARIREELRPVEGLDWITALRAPTIRKLVKSGTLQLSIFDRQDLAEITSVDFPGERLIACYNPLLAEERGRKRQELLVATEKELEKVAAATRRLQRPLRGRAKIALRVGRVLGRFKMGKHFVYEITDEGFTYRRDEERIREEVALDGIYVIRTSVPAPELDAKRVVGSYKSLSVVERAFRSCKSVDLKVRPIHHRREDRVRSHVFLCMLAYYVEWHMRQALAPILFDDHDRPAAAAARGSVVQPAQRSRAARRKALEKRTGDGFPVHSFQTLLQDLATAAKNRVRVADTNLSFDQYTEPTPLQRRAFELLQVQYPG
jgi:transposase